MKTVYRTYHEQDGKILINLIVNQEGDLFNISESVHDIDLKGIKSDELNQILKEINVSEPVKLEIKKAILDQHMGLVENAKYQLEILKPRIDDDLHYIQNEIEIELSQLEERLKELQTKLEDLVK